MIVFSSSTFSTALMLVSVFLVPVLWYLMKWGKTFRGWEVKLLLGCLALLAFRLFVPLELAGVTHSVFIKQYYTVLCDIWNYHLTEKITVFYAFVAVSLLGSLLLLLHRIRYYRRFLALMEHSREVRRIPVQRRLGREGMIRVVRSAYAIEPFLFGMIHPRIVLPEKMDGGEEYVIRHELEHYYHRDLWIKWGLELLGILYWWNPLVYLLKRRAGEFLELRNDYNVTKEYSQEEIIAYTEVLVRYARQKSAVKYGIGLGDCDFLAIRIKSLLYPEKKKTSFSLAVILVCLLTAASFGVVLEPSYPLPDEEGLFVLEDDIWFVKQGDGYELYVNGEYIMIIYTIPPEFGDKEIRYPEASEKAEEMQ